MLTFIDKPSYFSDTTGEIRWVKINNHLQPWNWIKIVPFKYFDPNKCYIEHFNTSIFLWLFLLIFFKHLSYRKITLKIRGATVVQHPNIYLNTLIRWQIDINTQRVAKKDIKREGTLRGILSKCLLLAICIFWAST